MVEKEKPLNHNDPTMASLSYFNIGGFLSRVDLKQETPVIDLSFVTFIEPFALIYLGLFLRHHNSKEKYLEWIVPKDAAVREYLSRMNFYERFKFSSGDNESQKALGSETSFNDIIDIKNEPGIAEEIGERLKRLLIRNSVKVNIEKACYITQEIVDNFAQHSRETLAAMSVQWFPQGGWLSLTFGDCGVGIKRSLTQNPKYRYLMDKTDQEAILKAFEPLVSRREQAGMGLTQTKEIILEEKGSLFLSSNTGYFAIREGKPWCGQIQFNLPGVQMEIKLPEGN